MKSRTNFRPVLVLAPGVLAGAEKVVLTGINSLSELGMNPLMVIIRETRVPGLAHDFQKALPSHIQSVMIDSKKALDINLPKRLKDVLKDETLPLVLHSHGFKALIACYMAKGKAPHLHTHHGNTGHTLKVRIYEKIAMMTMKSCDEVIAVSVKMKEELTRFLKPYNKITVVENMLSLSNAERIRNERNSRPEFSNSVIKLIYVGRLSPEKGLMPFLECLSKFPLKERFHLTVLGDGVERSLVENFIQENNLSSLITMHGFVADPSEFFIAPDILIMPSLREGLPMTLIEALASGIPVLSNDVGAIASLVTHGHNGYFSKGFALENWTEVLNMTLEAFKHWKKNAAIEAEVLEERFSSKLWAQRTIELYESNLN
ncbi:MAG: glycosyltransferase [Bacteriovorax sp.]|nr:glycosyltransferase [Bacteriovorax sp.]